MANQFDLTLLDLEQNSTIVATTYSDGFTSKASNEETNGAFSFLEGTDENGNVTHYILTGLGTYKLSTLKIPGEYNGLPVKEIAHQAFATFEDVEDHGGLENITGIEIPSSITKIGNGAFQYLPNLTTVIFADASNRGLDPLEIGEEVFLKCINLAGTVELPFRCNSIGAMAFEGCKKITKVYTGIKCALIGYQAFCGCSSLSSVVFGNANDKGQFPEETGLNAYSDSIKIIEYDAFINCTSLTYVYLPPSVMEIGECAFRGCTSLTQIEAGAKSWWFKGTSKKTGEAVSKDLMKDKTALANALVITDYALIWYRDETVPPPSIEIQGDHLIITDYYNRAEHFRIYAGTDRTKLLEVAMVYLNDDYYIIPEKDRDNTINLDEQ